MHGDAATMPNFTGGGDRVRYSIAVANAPGPFAVEAELLYQPIGYRWANNLKSYSQAPSRGASPATTTRWPQRRPPFCSRGPIVRHAGIARHSRHPICATVTPTHAADDVADRLS